MTFKVAARTLLHLGAELISSDGVAFYELIKNGLDAGSRVVRLDVVIALPQPSYRAFLEDIAGQGNGHGPGGNGSAASSASLEAVSAAAGEKIDPSAFTSG